MKPKIIKTTGTVYRWICPTCGRVINSLYLRQAESNVETHLARHDKKDKEAKDD